jgi:hypothetical protein
MVKPLTRASHQGEASLPRRLPWFLRCHDFPSSRLVPDGAEEDRSPGGWRVAPGSDANAANALAATAGSGTIDRREDGTISPRRRHHAVPGCAAESARLISAPRARPAAAWQLQQAFGLAVRGSGDRRSGSALPRSASHRERFRGGQRRGPTGSDGADADQAFAEAMDAHVEAQ